jgi:hypothetical protein
MKYVKLSVLIVLLMFSFFPLIVTSIYLFTGFSEGSVMLFILKIPTSRFWLIGIPALLETYFVTLYLWYKCMEWNKNKEPVVKNEKTWK